MPSSRTLIHALLVYVDINTIVIKRTKSQHLIFSSVVFSDLVYCLLTGRHNPSILKYKHVRIVHVY